MPQLKRVLTLRDVVLFNIVAIFGLRGMSTAAKMGPVAVPLWILAIVAFLVPHAFATAELATADPGEGGIYRWTRDAFGAAHGFLAGWFYWVSNVTYIVTLLTAFVGYAVYVLHIPVLGENAWLVTGVGLVVLWGSAWANVRGLELGRWVSNLGATAAWIAAALLIVVGGAVALRFGSATSWTLANIGAGFHDFSVLGYFGTLAFSLCGLELVAGMGDEVKDPGRTFPRAIMLSAPVIAALYLAGTIAVLVSQPAEQVSPISGAIGALQAGGDRLGAGALGTIGAALIAFATCAGVFAWIGGVARVPFAAGIDRYVPQAFARLHPRFGTPYMAIYIQAAVVTLCLLAAELGSSVREAFLVVLSMTIVMNFVPYVYKFLAVPRLRSRGVVKSGVASIPGGRFGLLAVTIAGTATTVLTIVASVVPTADAGDPLVFELKIWGGFALFSAIGYALYRRGSAQSSV